MNDETSATFFRMSYLFKSHTDLPNQKLAALEVAIKL